MCAMALRLVLVFRPVSPLSGHSHAAGRRGSPTLLAGLGPVRHTSLELKVKNYSPYMHPSLAWPHAWHLYVPPASLIAVRCPLQVGHPLLLAHS